METETGTIKCLAGSCRLARHEAQFTFDNAPGYTVLWCSLHSKAVIDLERCPDGKWEKDSKGYPIKTNPGHKQ
jgi:hypothetical protein